MLASWQKKHSKNIFYTEKAAWMETGKVLLQKNIRLCDCDTRIDIPGPKKMELFELDL